MLLHKGNEIGQGFACFAQLNPEIASHIEIFIKGLAKRIHCAPPGHGSASVRNASRSTLV